ncbi:DUF11 domain-containing protein [Methylomagnum ishizawai]|uniref:DUF11 domain-containing protein n=1 Tax=Methylomagnum ishizawai TaxID=1760988 RepID=UPI001C336147|nr:DUF11 domain-containing protein [Methylomagnum ishizawai]BBL76026.1 hypothetical protein MishRS11D_31240 [Methylomagnum ishizawai]
MNRRGMRAWPGVWVWCLWLLWCLWHPAGAVTTLAVGPGVESLPVVAVNTGNGELLAVWYDTTQSSAIESGAYDQVVGRRIDASGQPVGAVFLISDRVLSAPTLGGSRPAVAYNSKRGEFLVVYDRAYDGSTEPGLYAQRVSAEGLLLGDEITLSSGSGQGSARVAYDPVADRYLLVWMSDQGITGQFFDGAGAALGQSAVFAPSGAKNPALAFSPNSRRFLLAYEAASGSVSDILGFMIAADGSSGTQIALATAAGAQTTPGVAFNSRTNQFLVTWTDARDSTLPAAAYGQLLGDNGGLKGGNVKLAPAALAPRPVYSPVTGNYLVAWGVDDSASAKVGFIRGRLFKAGLASVGAGFFISADTTTSRPALIVRPAAGDAYAVWAGTSSGKSAIFGTLVPLAPASAKLSLAMTAQPVRAEVGETVTYALRVANKGSASAKTATLKDKLPASLTLVSATSDAGSCAVESNTAQCELGEIKAGAVVNVTVTATAAGLGKPVNTATLSWDNGGSTLAKVSAQTEVKIGYPGKLVLLSPNGGETLAAGSAYTLQWQVQGARNGDTLKFSLFYSQDGAITWTRIAKDVEGDSYPWTVPATIGNKHVRLRVVGYFNGKPLGQDLSDGRPLIEVLKLTSPNGGEQWSAGQVQTIAWTTQATRRPVAKVSLFYSRNGQDNWKKIADVYDNTGSFGWTVPTLPKPTDRAKVRVVLKDAQGVELGADRSDGAFGLD